LEDVRQEVRMNPDSVITNDQDGGFLVTRHSYSDVPTGRREFHRIGQQVHDDLTKASRVAANSATLGPKIDRQGYLPSPRT
jgi:hypothetical protein